MINEHFKIREEWRMLNIEINGHIKTSNQNALAGHLPSEEYTQWLNAKIAYRNELDQKLNSFGDFSTNCKSTASHK